MKIFRTFLAALTASVLIGRVSSVDGQTVWNDPNAGNWNDATWSSGGVAAAVPNAIGVEVVFNGLMTADNPDQTGNHNIAMNGDFTVGRLVFNTNRQFAAGTTSHRNQLNSFDVGGGILGVLTFDVAAGDATIFVPENAPIHGINTITAPMVFNDTVVATVDHTGTQSFLGALMLRGAISGSGGFTKLGNGRANFEHDAGEASSRLKTYTGPTLLAGGSLSISPASLPTMTSSFTIQGNAQLEPTQDGLYTFGTGPIVVDTLGLNSSGAIRPRRGGTAGSILTITNDIQVKSASLIHSQVQGPPAAPSPGSITLAGVISNHASSTGLLQFSAPSNGQLGEYIIQKDNTYSGGTQLRGGTLGVTSSVDVNASLGTGNVTLLGDPYADGGGAAFGRLVLEAGLTDAIGNLATLSLAGGDVGGVADEAYVDLGAGLNEVVSGLVLGGVAQGPGTYGSTLSTATNQNNEFFAGSGIITVAYAADFDFDGDVDGGDLTLWKGSFGPSTVGDADNDGDSDGADFAIWQQQQGSPDLIPSVVVAAAVPEPGALVLVAAGLPALMMRRRR